MRIQRVDTFAVMAFVLVAAWGGGVPVADWWPVIAALALASGGLHRSRSGQRKGRVRTFGGGPGSVSPRQLSGPPSNVTQRRARAATAFGGEPGRPRQHKRDQPTK